MALKVTFLRNRQLVSLDKFLTRNISFSFFLSNSRILFYERACAIEELGSIHALCSFSLDRGFYSSPGGSFTNAYVHWRVTLARFRNNETIPKDDGNANAQTTGLSIGTFQQL